MMDETGPSIKQIELERMHFAFMQYIREEMAEIFAILAKVSMEQPGQYFADGIVLRVRQDILGREIERIECRYPADWWQAVKERFAPKFILNRWPVKYIKHYVDVNVIYPNYRPALKDQEWRFKVSHDKYMWPEEDDD